VAAGQVELSQGFQVAVAVLFARSSSILLGVIGGTDLEA